MMLFLLGAAVGAAGVTAIAALLWPREPASSLTTHNGRPDFDLRSYSSPAERDRMLRESAAERILHAARGVIP
jgi:hypothetical protein